MWLGRVVRACPRRYSCRNIRLANLQRQSAEAALAEILDTSRAREDESTFGKNALTGQRSANQSLCLEHHFGNDSIFEGDDSLATLLSLCYKQRVAQWNESSPFIEFPVLKKC